MSVLTPEHANFRNDLSMRMWQVSTLERIYVDGQQKYGAHQMFLPTKRDMKKANFAATSSADEWRDTY